MLEKSTGAVGCFHCQTLGADKTCPVCKRPVCDACASGRDCPVPHRRELRLGMGRRLRAVDATGVRGVVSGWTRNLTLVDLDSGGRVAPMGHFKHSGAWSGPWPVLASARKVVFAGVTITRQVYLQLSIPEQPGVTGLDLPEGRASTEKMYVDKLAASEDGSVAAVVRSDMLLDLVDLQQLRLMGTVDESREAIQSLALSREWDLLVLGLYGKLRLFSLVDRRYLGTLNPRKLDGDVVWVGLSRSRLAAVSDNGHCVVLELSRQAPAKWPTVAELQLTIPSTMAGIVGEMPRGNRRVVAGLSPDGALLAVRQGRKLVHLYRLPGQQPMVLEGHTDRVNLVQFVGGGRQLITADHDNRVFFWPRKLLDPTPSQ